MSEEKFCYIFNTDEYSKYFTGSPVKLILWIQDYHNWKKPPQSYSGLHISSWEYDWEGAQHQRPAHFKGLGKIRLLSEFIFFFS